MATPNTGIPYIPENTIDPAAGLNLSLNTIDALLQTTVVSMGSNAPPGSPADGALHIVGSSPTGAWAGQANNLARYVAEGAFWQFYAAGDQVRIVFNGDDGGLYAWSGIAWAVVAGIPDAPSDGNQYARQDGAWQPVAGASRSPAVQSVTSSATVTPNFANDLVKITAQAEALTLANPSGTAIDGWGIVIRIKDNGTARAISYGTQYRAIGVTLPTTTVVGKALYIAGIWNSEDTTFDIVAVGQQA